MNKIKRFNDIIIKESKKFDYELEDVDFNELKDCLSSLKKVKQFIPREELIVWFNENDIDYYTMSDLEMYIYIIENNI